MILASLLGLLVGVSGPVWWSGCALCSRITKQQQSFLIGFSGGIMLGVVGWDLIPGSLGADYGLGGLLPEPSLFSVYAGFISSTHPSDRSAVCAGRDPARVGDGFA